MAADPDLFDRLRALVGRWDLTATIDGRVMSEAKASFDWAGDRLLAYRTEPPAHLAPQWRDAAPQWVHAVIGLDDHAGEFTQLYTDSRGVCRVYRMLLDGDRWIMSSRPGGDFFQRFDGVVDEDTITGRWQASPDGHDWSTDFDVVYRRVAG